MHEINVGVGAVVIVGMLFWPARIDQDGEDTACWSDAPRKG